MKISFIGHFSPFNQASNNATSTAGNQVQREIINELGIMYGLKNVLSYSMAPISSYPDDILINPLITEENIAYLNFINIHVLKHITFSARLFLNLIKYKPKVCVQYNSYLFENICLIIYRLIYSKTILVIFIQDINITPKSNLLTKIGLRSLSEKISIWLAKYFDIIIPISINIINDFGIDNKKCIIFQGGLTRFSYKLLKNQSNTRNEIAVFAGGLEPHNGIDKLVHQWILQDIKYELHIFGRGTLENLIREQSAHTKNIIFHGFKPEEVIEKWQSESKWNFCLRYSVGIDQRYFFPSKFFNILCAPGMVVVNNFNNLPHDLKDYLIFVDDDLTNLNKVLLSTTKNKKAPVTYERYDILQKNHTWENIINQIDAKINSIFNE